jgi:hypothetical protein
VFKDGSVVFSDLNTSSEEEGEHVTFKVIAGLDQHAVAYEGVMASSTADVREDAAESVSTSTTPANTQMASTTTQQ